MSEIEDAAAFAPPEGVAWMLWAGWDFLPGEGYAEQLENEGRWPETVQLLDTRAGKLAQRFHNNVWVDEEFIASLYFEIINSEQVALTGVVARNKSDLEDVLATLTDIRPLKWWRTISVRHALMQAFPHGLDSETLAERYKTLLMTAITTPELIASGEVGGPETIDQASEIAALPIRGRITAALLQEVARVYREAFSAGRPPTEAVASYFDKPRSTAGRWVSQARRAGALGPADGPRAGEADLE